MHFWEHIKHGDSRFINKEIFWLFLRNNYFLYPFKDNVLLTQFYTLLLDYMLGAYTKWGPSAVLVLFSLTFLPLSACFITLLDMAFSSFRACCCCLLQLSSQIELKMFWNSLLTNLTNTVSLYSHLMRGEGIFEIWVSLIQRTPPSPLVAVHPKGPARSQNTSIYSFFIMMYLPSDAGLCLQEEVMMHEIPDHIRHHDGCGTR